jgi:hypothetical protein
MTGQLLFNTCMEKYGGNIIWLAKESNPSFLKELNPLLERRLYSMDKFT